MGEEGRGRVPPDIFHREIFFDLLEIENGRGKIKKVSRGPVSFLNFIYLFICLSPFETTEICLGSTKMDYFFTGKKHISSQEKIGESDLPPPPPKIFLILNIPLIISIQVQPGYLWIQTNTNQCKVNLLKITLTKQLN